MKSKGMDDLDRKLIRQEYSDGRSAGVDPGSDEEHSIDSRGDERQSVSLGAPISRRQRQAGLARRSLLSGSLLGTHDG